MFRGVAFGFNVPSNLYLEIRSRPASNEVVITTQLLGHPVREGD